MIDGGISVTAFFGNQAGVLNIGGEGQAIMGGLGTGLVAMWLSASLPAWAMLPIMLIAGALFGMVWAAVPGSAPDGICLGDRGIWYADVPNESCVLVAQGGDVLRRLDLGQGAFSCAVGGEDANMLLVMAADWPGALDPGAPPSGRAVLIGLGDPDADAMRL